MLAKPGSSRPPLSHLSGSRSASTHKRGSPKACSHQLWILAVLLLVWHLAAQLVGHGSCVSLHCPISQSASLAARRNLQYQYLHYDVLFCSLLSAGARVDVNFGSDDDDDADVPKQGNQPDSVKRKRKEEDLLSPSRL